MFLYKTINFYIFLNYLVLGMFVSIGTGTTSDPEAALRKLLVKPELVRFLVIESKAQYCCKILYAAATLLCHLMVGAVNLAVFKYSIATRDYHATLCTVSLHLLTVEAIAAYYFSNGCAIYMHKRHRKLTHIFLQILSCVFLLGGLAAAYFKKGFEISGHHVIGLLSSILVLAAACLGPFIKKKKLEKLGTHIIIGLLAFLLSSISMIMTFYSKAFKKELNLIVVILLTIFVCFYTVFIEIYSCDRLIKRF